jgi:hypothetical protein
MMISEILRLPEDEMFQSSTSCDSGNVHHFGGKFGNFKIEDYPGLYKEQTKCLYQTIRCLYSLAYHSDIAEILQRIESQQRGVTKDGLSELFESAVERIVNNVPSPIAKVICYYNLFELMVAKPDHIDQVGADEMLNLTLKYIIQLQKWDTIVGLYVDAKIMEDLIPDDISA